MLTIPVNIAVFAAFWPRVGGILLSNPQFKPLCRLSLLDVLGYGWQQRQETARMWQRMARSAAKTARFGEGAARSTPLCPRLPPSGAGFLRMYAVVQVLAASDSAA
jgi:hypothetical protein